MKQQQLHSLHNVQIHATWLVGAPAAGGLGGGTTSPFGASSGGGLFGQPNTGGASS